MGHVQEESEGGRYSSHTHSIYPPGANDHCAELAVTQHRRNAPSVQTPSDILNSTHIQVERKGLVVGGQVTCVFLSLTVILALNMLDLFGTSPTPTLPGALSEPLLAFTVNQRIVDTVPYASLDAPDSSVLDDWIVAHDNLYAVEVLGGDWGTTCVDYGVVRDMDTQDMLQVVYGASAGILPMSVTHGHTPTTVTDIRESGGIVLQTEGCTIQGSGMPCESLYNNGWFDPLQQPVVAYACFRDDVDVYHHYTLISTALGEGYPEGMDIEYSASWVPSAKYPLMGKESPAAVKVHVVPPAVSLAYMGGKGDQLTPSYSFGRFDTERQLACGMLYALTEAGYTLTSYERNNRFSRCFAISDSGTSMQYTGGVFGQATLGENAWDTTRTVSQVVAPLPTTPLSVGDYSCGLYCEGDECMYTGQLCQ
ncbi:hypothetical protein KIPB_010696, partial [Kipferlia bialata]|eukprot:g10696.t1